MVARRAHFDGQAIVPDEPIDLPPQTRVVILIDADDPAAAGELEQAVREYYLKQPAAEAAEDAAWGQAVAPDIRQAWDRD
jgi:hypothetical protein